MDILSIIQIIVSILLIVFILLQQRGSGLSSVLGGGESGGGNYFQKRGMEKIFFWGTVVLSVLFFGLAITIFLFK